MEKQCKICKGVLPLEAFHANTASKDGRDSRCKGCIRQRYLDNREAVIARSCARQREKSDEKREYDRQRRERLGAEYINRVREYYFAHSEARKAYIRQYKQKNKQKVREWNSLSDRRNPEKRRERKAKRRAAERLAVPAWANHSAIIEIYIQARSEQERTGVEMHVDHIVPLRSKIVCGLHCEANLRVIPASENVEKGNRYWPDMP